MDWFFFPIDNTIYQTINYEELIPDSSTLPSPSIAAALLTVN